MTTYDGAAGTPAGDTLDVSGTAQVPFSRIVAVELRKMGDTRAGKWLLITIAAITLLVVGLLLVFAHGETLRFTDFLNFTASPQGVLLPVLGVLLVTSEWGQRAALTTFTLVPHRERIIGGKLAAAVLSGLAAIAVAIVLAALAALVHGTSDPWRGVGPGDLGTFGLLQTVGILQGLAFGMLFLNSAAAIVTYFVLPIAFSIVIGVVHGLHSAGPWIDLGAAKTPLLPGGQGMSGHDWAHLATAFAIWVVVPMAIGTWRMMRAEVK
jgi:ABC-type transport system involved in multi-copper enzyme maturation permease subunit